MAIGGPRLDRPSAVGDEGRTRGTSLTVAALVVLSVLIGAGFLVGQPLMFLSVGLFVVLTTAGIALLGRDRLWPNVLGHLCFLPSVIVVSTVVAGSGFASLFVPGLVFLIGGAIAAMFGVASGWNDAFDREAVKTALFSSGLSYIFWLVGLVILGLVGGLGWLGREVVLALTSGTGPVAAAFGLFALVALASGCLYVAVRAMPAIQLTPVHRREKARARYRKLRSVLIYVTLGALGLIFFAVLGVVTGVLQTVLVAPLSTLLVSLAAVTAIPLASVAVLSLLLAALAWALRRSTSGFNSLSTRTVGAVIAAVCYNVLFALSFFALLRYGALGVAFFFALPVLPLFVYTILTVALIGFSVGAIPDRAGSSALAATGLISMGLGGALYGLPSLFVFSAVAGGLVVWDVGTFGLSVTAELGHIPETRRLELYHGVFAVGIGLVGVAGLTALDATRQAVGSAIGTPATMGIAVLGVLLVALSLRG